MKNKLIVASLALAFTVPTHAQSTNAAPIVIAPVSATVLKPATGTLTSAQVAALVTALHGAGITFSGGYVQNLNVRLSFKLAPSGQYVVTFYPTVPTN
jgi:hypothetical protein